MLLSGHPVRGLKHVIANLRLAGVVPRDRCGRALHVEGEQSAQVGSGEMAEQ